MVTISYNIKLSGTMETIQIKSAAVTLEDLVFENRNKAYGAYYLSHHNTKYLLVAFMIALLGISSAFIVPFVKAIRNLGTYIAVETTIPIILTPITPTAVVDPITIPAPPAPVVPKSIAQQPVYEVPTIGKNNNPDDQPPPVIETLNTIPNIPVHPDIPVAINNPDPVIPPDDKPFLNPQEPASFMNGDENTFRTWVIKNMVYPQSAIENGVTGKLFIVFCVNSQGEIVDIKILNKADPSLAKEAMRVLMSSPKWKPARQGGNVVKQLFSMPLVFVMS
jgi:protein TonB